eukprot:3927321-Pyramimonas_sp.AAC.1
MDDARTECFYSLAGRLPVARRARQPSSAGRARGRLVFDPGASLGPIDRFSSTPVRLKCDPSRRTPDAASTH